MLLDDVKKQITGTETGLKFARTILNVQHTIEDWIGNFQLVTRQPLTICGTAQVAVKQWKAEVEKLHPPEKDTILIAAIRNQRWIEWAIFSACYVIQMGYRPIILFSSDKIKQTYGDNDQFWSIAQTLPYIDWVDFDDYLSDLHKSDTYVEFARQDAHTVAAYNLEVEEFEPDQAPDEYEKELQLAEKMLLRYAIATEQILKQYPDYRLICPSGLIEESLAIHEVTQQLQHEAIYVEGWALRPGHNIWNLNQPALEYDIQGWLGTIDYWENQLEHDSQAYMKFREGHQVEGDGWLDNFHQVQIVSKDETLPQQLVNFLQRDGKFVLLGTNVVGDSSTLRRQTIFRSQEKWLRDTIEFFKKNPQYNLIVRAHPDELWVKARLRLAEIAKKYSDNVQNIFVVSSEDKVNTYALVDRIDVGLAWVSNIGLDMALRDKPVIMGAKPKYTGLGVVHEPATQTDYFELLSTMIENPTSPSMEAMYLGKAFHHVVFKLISLESDDLTYNSTNYRLGKKYQSEDQHKFYEILVGERDNYGYPAENMSNVEITH